MISPSTANVPTPQWWIVFGAFWLGSFHALTTSRTKRQYLFTSRVSTTRHSRFAKHSAISGAFTSRAGTGVRSNASNLSMSRPELLPTCTTFSANSTAWGNGDYALFGRPQGLKAVVGIADDTGDQRRFELYHHVPGHRHDIGPPLPACGQRTTGPGSRIRYTFDNGSVFIATLLYAQPLGSWMASSAACIPIAISGTIPSPA